VHLLPRLYDITYAKVNRTCNPEEVKSILSETKEICKINNPYCNFIGALDIKRYSGFKTLQLIINGIKDCLSGGLSQINIYGIAWTPLAYNPNEVPVEIWKEVKKEIKKWIK